MQTTTVNETEYRLLQTKVTRKDDEFGHSYWDETEGYLIGCTTLLGMAIPKDEGLIEYFKRGDKFEMEEYLNETSAQGTRVHQAAELLMLGEVVKTDTLKTMKEKKCIAAFIEWFRTWNPQNVMTEQVVVYIKKRPELPTDLKYAGTLDILCKLGDEWAVIDIKTGRQSPMNHGLQIRSYGEAVNQSIADPETGKPIKVTKYFALYLGTAHKTNVKTKNTAGLQKSGLGWNTEESFYTWDDFVRVYDYGMFLQGNKYPEPPKVQVFPTEFKLLTEIQGMAKAEENQNVPTDEPA